MPDINQTRTLETKRTIRELKLNRETLRELDAGPAGPGPTRKCITEWKCTRACV